jgi:iron(III) transport system permease protein
MPRYAWTTVKLVGAGGARHGGDGTATAWLVTMCRFPGSRTFEIVLALPLAFPGLCAGLCLYRPARSSGRGADGAAGGHRLGAARLLVPRNPLARRRRADADLRSLPLCLSARPRRLPAQSPTAYFAARTMGHGPWSAFFRVSLPMARPAIAGGTILALMETIADFGTVAHFGVQTFATGIYQAWFSMGDRGRLAACLLPDAGGADLRRCLKRPARRGKALSRRLAGRGHDAPSSKRLARAWRRFSPA